MNNNKNIAVASTASANVTSVANATAVNNTSANVSSDPMSVCLEKFYRYADAREIKIFPQTYGFYEVRKGDNKKILGAVKAVTKDGATGWVINWADKQRKFAADGDKSIVVGKAVSKKDCFKARKRQKKSAPQPVED
ncbi:MAG: hypothetical protein J6J35_00495 [Alphaproteobacteria bacterium]|nr:hypothetical protein [Alphaproteobacteria bacterium]